MAAETPPDAPRPQDDSAQALQDLEELLKRIPGAQKLANELRELRALIVERRAPRIAAIGRRGSGKSALANALVGAEVLPVGAVEDTTVAPAWCDVSHAGRTLRWLDTPGLRAGDTPGRASEVAKALKDEAPDVVLVLCKATQVDAGIDEDLDAVRAILEDAGRERLSPPRVVGVVTKVDELAPLTVKSPPYDQDETKKANVARAVETLRGHFQRAGIAVGAVVPVAGYQRFKDGRRVTDWRWNLEALGEAVFSGLPRQAQVEAARAFERSQALRRRLAMRIVGTATSVSFVVGATPLPVADLAVLLPLQSTMLTGVVYVSGRPFGPRAVTEWLGGVGLNVGAGVGLREAWRAVVKLVPGIGGTVAGAVAASGTWALGVAAVKYFVDGATLAESRAALAEAAKEGAPAEPREREGD